MSFSAMVAPANGSFTQPPDEALCSAVNPPEAGSPTPAPVRCMVSMPPVACISSGSLLAGANEVLIDHHGALYRLKQTALGKLILTK